MSTQQPQNTAIIAAAGTLIANTDGTLPWSIRGDLAYFRRTTYGHTIVMGRRTWEALPARPLPGRTNIIVSSRKPGEWSTGATVIHSVDDIPAGSIIIGGAHLLAATIHTCAAVHLTEVYSRAPWPTAGVHLPEGLLDGFTTIDTGVWRQDPGDIPRGVAYRHKLLARTTTVDHHDTLMRITGARHTGH